MVRRWLIRSLALTVLTLCVTVWVGSYWLTAFVTYSHTSSVQIVVNYGKCSYDYASSHSVVEETDWQVRVRPIAFDIMSASGEDKFLDKYTWKFLGFKYFHINSPWTDVSITIPLYFPSLLAALGLWFVWRKTGPIRAGFPIEPALASKAVPSGDDVTAQ